MGDLSSRDQERAKFVFEVYDFDASGVIDAFNLGDALRALGLNPTQKAVEKLGGTKKKNEKKMKLDEFLPCFAQTKKDKDVGGFEDFVECLKLYDKQENGTMMAAELSHVLLSLGERLEESEVDAIMKECSQPEDDEGYIPYEPFLKKLVAGPPECEPV